MQAGRGNAETLAGLIECTYDAAIDPGQWAAWMRRLESAIPFASLGLVFYEDKPSSVVASTTADECVVGQYMDHYYKHDAVTQRLLGSRGFDLLVDDEIMDDEAKSRSEFYRDYLGRMGLYRGLHAAPLRRDGQVAILGLHRPRDQSGFTRDEIGLVERLLPHLERSLRVHQRMQAAAAAQAAAAQVSDQAGIGLIVVKADGRICFSNPLAETHLKGRGLTVAGGVVHGLRNEATRELHAAIARAASPTGAVGQSVVLPIGPCGGKVTVMVMPVRPGCSDYAAEPLAMLVFGRESAPATGEQSGPQKSYGLTGAESRLLAALVSGERLPDYAARTGISPTTAKTHLRSLFDKTGERRQADLIRLAMTDPALRMAIEPQTLN